MNKKAILYTRVSTDEQAVKGYSLNDQHEKLKVYCAIHNIEVVGHFQDNYSAKSFERPSFRKLIEFLKRNKNIANLLLFIKWDRFSRNAGESYEMLKMLKAFNIEAQATEQPLDLSIPESKLMLALYLASPEVENDRRSLNVSAGMRRAIKDGRWVVKAPKGYENKRDENNKPIIVPGKDAKYIKEAFEMIATGEYSQSIARVKLNKEGLNCSISNFSCLLRNPVYIGKIKLKATKDEEEKLVKGLHQPLIDENTFNIVQEILSGKKERQNIGKLQRSKPELPLRGFLECPRCGKKLTGSASKGQGGRYFYYHCSKGCGERHRATEVNRMFLKLLEEIQPNENEINLYNAVLKDLLSENEASRKENSNAVRSEIVKIQERLVNLQDKLIDNQIGASDYNAIKLRYNSELHGLQQKLVSMSQLSRDIYDQLVLSHSFLQNLPSKFQNSSLEVQQRILSSIFPGKLVYSENKVRTTKINEVVQLFTNTSAGFSRNKKGQFRPVSELSFRVAPTGIEPVSKV